MTKIQKANQQEMGYVPKLIPNTCSNCFHFACDVELDKTPFGVYSHTTNLRCIKGGFPVKKMGTCNEWTGKV